MSNTTNLDFSEQNKRIANVECKSTLTSIFNSCSLQPITPTTATAHNLRPIASSLAPPDVGVMSKYSDTPSRTNPDFPGQNTAFATHERRSTPTQNVNFRAAHLMPQVSRRSSPRVGVALGYPNRAVPKNRKFPAANPTRTRPTCWFTPTRNFDFCASLRFNSVPSAPCSLPVLILRSRFNLNGLRTVVPLMTRSTPATRIQEIARHPSASYASFCSKKRQRVTQRAQQPAGHSRFLLPMAIFAQKNCAPLVRPSHKWLTSTCDPLFSQTSPVSRNVPNTCEKNTCDL